MFLPYQNDYIRKLYFYHKSKKKAIHWPYNIGKNDKDILSPWLIYPSFGWSRRNLQSIVFLLVPFPARSRSQLWLHFGLTQVIKQILMPRNHLQKLMVCGEARASVFWKPLDISNVQPRLRTSLRDVLAHYLYSEWPSESWVSSGHNKSEADCMWPSTRAIKLCVYHSFRNAGIV